MSVDQGIALVGIVIGVVLAVGGFFLSKKIRDSRRSQAQRVDRGGIGIQSGRDTNIDHNA